MCEEIVLRIFNLWGVAQRGPESGVVSFESFDVIGASIIGPISCLVGVVVVELHR